MVKIILKKYCIKSQGGSRVKFFLDTANVEDIRRAVALGVVAGVTTNPSLVAKEKRDLTKVIEEITTLVPGPVSAEVVSVDTDGMVAEGEKLAAIASNVVVKIPMTEAGLAAVHKLSQKGIKTNVTLIFSVNQALLAARAGASYVSPFVGRLDDIGQDGIALVADIVELFQIHALPTEVIAASIRHTMHVTQAAMAGAHIATVPYSVLQQMTKHPLTTSGLEKFLADWKQATAEK